MAIKVQNLTKVFDDKKVLDNISFTVEEGEILSIVGFSGSGKSTILKILCGLLSPDSGIIDIGDGDVAMVFQYSALFDSLNVFDNISFALHERKEFKVISELIPLSESIIHKTAVCRETGNNASFSYKISNNTNVIEIGGNDKYEAVDRQTYFKLRKKM